MNELEVTDRDSIGINEINENPTHDNTAVWVVTSMLVIWICVITMSLF